MRAFIAIEIPATVQAACGRLIAALRPDTAGVRWVRTESMHLTLRFLGDIEEATGATIMEALAPPARATAPFALAASGMGCFPNLRKPSVVWVGLQPADDGLAYLQAAAELAAQQAGLAPERRAFKPHLTLGRIRQPAPYIAWAEIAKKHAGFDAGAWTVQDVSLFASELHPSGARYQRLVTLSLGNSA